MRLVRRKEPGPPQRTWFVPIFHGPLFTACIVKGLNATGYFHPFVSATRRYVSSVLNILSLFDPLILADMLSPLNVLESVKRTIGNLKSNGVTIAFLSRVTPGGGFKLSVLMRTLRAQPYSGPQNRPAFVPAEFST
jgi:hypothetical protein